MQQNGVVICRQKLPQREESLIQFLQVDVPLAACKTKVGIEVKRLLCAAGHFDCRNMTVFLVMHKVVGPVDVLVVDRILQWLDDMQQKDLPDSGEIIKFR